MRYLIFSIIFLSIEFFAQNSCNSDDGNKFIFRLKRRETSSEVVKNSKAASKKSAPISYMDFEYYSILSVGTPAQHFKCSFNFQFSDFWIPHTSCNTCGNSKSKFNQTKSSSFVNGGKSVKMSTSGGSQMNGVTAYDTVNINGFKVTKQGLVLVKSEAGPILNFKIDGHIGLGFSSQSFTKFPTFVDNLLSQKLIPTKTVGLWLNSNTSSSNGGEIMFGGYNSAHYTGKIAWTKISKTDTWQFKIESITASGKSTKFCQNCQASIQSIISVIRGPDSQVASLMKAIGATLNKDLTYVVDCSKMSSLPNIVFKISEISFSLSPKIYVNKQDNVCTVLIFGGTDIWLLGNPFNRGIYTMYDMTEKKIGFATAK